MSKSSQLSSNEWLDCFIELCIKCLMLQCYILATQVNVKKWKNFVEFPEVKY